MAYKKATVAAEDTYTSNLYVPAGSYINISILPTVTGTADVYLQRAYLESPTVWHNDEVYVMADATEHKEDVTVSPQPEDIYYRIGVPTGEYTSGTFDVRIGCQEVV